MDVVVGTYVIELRRTKVCPTRSPRVFFSYKFNTPCTRSFGREQTEQNGSGREYLVRLVATKQTRLTGVSVLFQLSEINKPQQRLRLITLSSTTN